jgi:hypothetical protein
MDLTSLSVDQSSVAEPEDSKLRAGCALLDRRAPMWIRSAASAVRNSPRARKAAAPLLALLLLVATLPLLAALAQPGTSSSDVVIEDFNQGAVLKPDRLVIVEGFQLGDRGWYVDPGATGRLVYRVPGKAGAAIGVNLWVYSPAGVTNSVSVSAPDLPTVQLVSNINYLGDRLKVPPQYASASSIDVQIVAHNSSSAQQLVIDQLEIYAVQGADPRAPPFYTFLAFGALVAMLAWLVIRRRDHALPAAIGIGVVSAIAAATRVSALFTLTGPVDPDAIFYRVFADRFQWWPLFDNGIFSGNFAEREPLYPMVVHIYFQVLGSSDFTERVVSVTLSIAVVIVSIVAARRRLQTWWAPVLVGFVVAVSGPLIQESYRGLRLELETLLILGLYLALDRGPVRRPLLDAVMVGLLGAAMALTRTYYIPVFIAAVSVTYLLRYRSPRRVVGLVLVATLIMGAAETAHRVGMFEHHQNAFWDTARYVRWSANEELFRFHRPLPHAELFPTLGQYQSQGPYTGPSITNYQYLFVLHSPVELVRDSLAGSRGIFDSMDSFTFDVRAAANLQEFPSRLTRIASAIATRVDLLLRWMVLLGLMAMCVGALRERRLIIIPTIVVTWLGMTAFLLDHEILEQYRHTWQTYPLALIAAGWLLESVAIFAARHAHWRQIVNVDNALFATSILLTAADLRTPHSLRPILIALIAADVAVLSYRRPAWGLGASILSLPAGDGALGAMAAVASVSAILLRLRPPIRKLMPLIAFVPLLAIMLAAGGGWSSASVETVAIMVAITTAVAVAVRQPEIRNQVLWLLAAIGPLAGVMYLLEPARPGAVGLVPVGVVAAAWLYLSRNSRALWLGLFDLALLILIEPLAAWIGVAVVIAWMVVQAGRVRSSRRLILAGALTAIVAAIASGASLAATTPPADAAWSTRLSASSSSIRQEITVDRPGDNSIWIYARRSSVLTDFPFSVIVDGQSVTADLNSYLPTDVMTWNRIPLTTSPHVGDRLEVEITAGGQPNPVDRYIDVGGVYATADGINSPGTNGTYLVVLGDASLPLAPGGLPEPMVRNRLQPPMGDWMPGEIAAPIESRQEAGVLQIWRQTLGIAVRHPLGIGTGELAAALFGSGAGIGPGLTARSEPLQVLAEWGFVGAGALLLLMAAAAWVAYRAHDRLATGLLVLAAITMVGESILAEPAGAASLWFALGFCFGAIGSHAGARSVDQSSLG